MFRHFCLTLIFAFTTSQLIAGEALAYMQNLITNFESLRSELVRDFSEQNRKVVSARARDLAIELSEIDEIGRLALGQYAAKIKEKDLRDFYALFHELMANRVVAANLPSQKMISNKIPIEIVAERSEADEVFKKEALVVNTNVPHKKQSFKVEFYLYRSASGLKLYDVHVDGASTLLDFRNQFSSIIKKEGIKSLIKRLREKIKKIK